MNSYHSFFFFFFVDNRTGQTPKITNRVWEKTLQLYLEHLSHVCLLELPQSKVDASICHSIRTSIPFLKVCCIFICQEKSTILIILFKRLKWLFTCSSLLLIHSFLNFNIYSKKSLVNYLVFLF